MKLYELDDNDALSAYYSVSDDKLNRRIPTDTRKSPVLTLRAINRLKKMRAVQKLETLQRHDLFALLYATPEEEAGGGGGGGFGGFP